MTHWTHILAVDHDKAACATYAANVPGARVVCGEVHPDLLAPLHGELDVLCGGPPCQPFSVAGKGKGQADERDGIPAFVECVRASRPRHVIMEQVPGVLRDSHRSHYINAINAIRTSGYRVHYLALDAFRYGVPQFRKRIWAWAIRSDLDAIPEFPHPTHERPGQCDSIFGTLAPWVTVREALNLDGEVLMQSHADPPRGVDLPSTTLRSGGAGHDGCRVYVMGGGSNPREPGGVRTERDITDEPSTTIAAHHTHNALPSVVIRRPRGFKGPNTARPDHPIDEPSPLIDANPTRRLSLVIRRARGASVERPDHPIDEPSPAVTVVDGGSSGLFVATKTSILDRPCPTISSGGTRTGGADPIVNSSLRGEMSIALGGGEVIRHLTPDECLRLQSGPVDWVWPAISKTAKYRIIGNGWACGMAAAIARAVQAADPRARTVADVFAGGGLGAVGWSGRYWRRDGLVAMEGVA